ncbi:cytochrome P450 714C2-like [Cornus florida]|uniref:cytochrome P450 714C2-like n=1 Tax=Cornus florida TaxID=4283 RepID=UPI002898C4A3|nr:cytochrome P450 714C2-like [Cornus florida]
MEEAMNMLIWLIVVCLSSLCIHVYNVLWVRPERVREKLSRQGIRGPPPSFLTGNVSQMKRISSDHIEASAGPLTANYALSMFPYFERWTQIYGQVYMYTTGNVQNLYISDLGVVKEISLFKSWDLGKPVYLSPQLRSLLGDSVVRSNGQAWAHQKKIIAPEFFVDKVKVIHRLPAS